METSIKSVLLGLKPFILIEFTLDEDETIVVDVQAGGGVEAADVPEMLRDLGEQFIKERE